MNVARSLVGTVLVVLSSAGLAHNVTVGVVASGSRDSTGSSAGHAPAASGHAAAKAVGGAHGASSLRVDSGALEGATVTHVSIGGELATVVMLAPHPPLTAAEREKIRKAGYVPVVQGGATYYCQRTPSGPQGWVNDCFQFASLSDLPKSNSSSKEAQGSGSQKSASPEATGAAPSRAMVAVFSPAS
jgi:hypothetical protein